MIVHATFTELERQTRTPQRRKTVEVVEKSELEILLRGEPGPFGDSRRVFGEPRFKKMGPCGTEFVGDALVVPSNKEDPLWATHEIARVFASLDFDGFQRLIQEGCVCAAHQHRHRKRQNTWTLEEAYTHGGPEGTRGNDSEMERERGLASTCCTPLSVSSPFVLLLIRCPHGTVLLVMVGLDHMAVGMDVDVAVGVESQKYAPMSNGSARSAVLGTGGVVRIADTVRVSRTTMRMPRRPRHRKKLLSWRRRLLVWVMTNLFWRAREFWKKNSTNSKGSSMARRKRQSTSRPNKIGSTENPNASSQRVLNWRSGKRASECEKKL